MQERERLHRQITHSSLSIRSAVATSSGTRALSSSFLSEPHQIWCRLEIECSSSIRSSGPIGQTVSSLPLDLAPLHSLPLSTGLIHCNTFPCVLTSVRQCQVWVWVAEEVPLLLVRQRQDTCSLRNSLPSHQRTARQWQCGEHAKLR